MRVHEIAVKRGYCPKLEATSYETYRGSTDFMASAGPATLNHRYMTEDIPFSALVISVFGRTLGVPTPLFDAMITVCSAMMDEDYWKSGRTAEALGITGMDKEKLLDFLQYGYK
jgi:opine dehydrogenase